MPRIENAGMESDIADSLLGPETEQQESPAEAVSEYHVPGVSLLDEYIAESQDNRFRDGDEQHERLRSERPEVETGEEQAHQGRQQPQTQREAPEQQQGAPEATPIELAATIQELDTRMEQYGLSEPADTSKFGTELASAFGADVHRDGWDVGLLNNTVARIALSDGPQIMAAEGDFNRLPPISPLAQHQIASDVITSFGRDPRLQPAYDERLLANTIRFAVANILYTHEKTGERDPAKGNDAQMAVWFLDALHMGMFGTEKPGSVSDRIWKEMACQVADTLWTRLLGMDGKVREWNERNAAAQNQGRRAGVGRGRGQRIPAQFREGIKGSKAPRFKTNAGPDDPFNNQTMDDYAQRNARL